MARGFRRLWQGIGMSAKATEQKRVSESEERFRAIFSQTAVGMALIGLDGTWLLVNNRLCEMLGYTEAELRSKTLQELTHPDDWDEARSARARLLASEIPSHTMDKRYIRKDGTIFWGRLHRSLARDRDNKPRYIISLIEDITEKIQAENALKASEERFALAQKAAQLGVWDRELHTNAIVISGEYAKTYGLDADHPPLTYEEWLRLIHPDDRERVRGRMRDTIKRTHVWNEEFRIVWKDGTVRWVLGKGAVSLDDSGRPVRITGINLDITERKVIEAALHQSELLNKEVLKIIPDCIFVLDVTSHGRFKFVELNPAEEKAVGLSSSEVAGKFVQDVLPPEVSQQVIAHYRRCLEAGTPIHYDDELNLPIGRRYFSSNLIPLRNAAGRIHRVVGCCTDLTEVKRAQEEAMARQKLEGMGLLAGGIAHDFNNLLGGILASSELALTNQTDVCLIEEELQRIRTAAMRGAEIVRQLMIYGGNESQVFGPVDVSLLIEDMLELMKVSISKRARLTLELGRGLPAVQANPSQIRRVVMNLITNASEAIGDRDGEIRVRTAQAPLGQEQRVSDVAKLAEGNYIQLEVSDTGAGMTSEVQERIFDPFFTTKFPGRGLGLAVVQGVVRDHKGAIEFVSSPGHGTTFLIWLPCAANKARETSKPTMSVMTKEIDFPARTILVVEDENVLRLAVSKALRNRGFAVIEASDGSRAIDLLRSHKDKVDVVFLDVTLPGVSSREIFEEAQRIRPNLKVIVTTAYAKETVDIAFSGLRVDYFIRKPFHLFDVLRLIGDALSA